MGVIVCKECKKSLHTSNFRSSTRNGITTRFGVCNNCMVKSHKSSDFSSPTTNQVKKIDDARRYWTSRGVTVRSSEGKK